jgi:ATP-dependent Clp protease ATP-binding subunit ClpE
MGFSGSSRSLEDLEATMRIELAKIMRPELINRFDALLPFKNLEATDIKKIVTKELSNLQNKLASGRAKIELTVDSKVIDHFTENYDPKRGVRGLRADISRGITDKLTELDIKKNAQKVSAKFTAGSIIITS